MLLKNVTNRCSVCSILGAYQDKGQLVIPQCKKEYEGRYVCTIYFLSGEQKVAYTSLHIEDGVDDGDHYGRNKYITYL